MTALLALGLLAFLSVPASAQEATRYDTTYRPLVSDGLVSVTTTFTVGAARSVTTFVPTQATDIESNVPVRVVPLDDDFYQQVTLDASTAPDGNAVLSYVLPSDPPRSFGDTRVNQAHISFYVWTDPFFENGSVRVVVPTGFAANVDPELMTPTSGDDGGVIWVADPVSDPDGLFFRLVATNETGLVRTPVEVEDEVVTIASWADDPEWLSFTTEQVRRGIPLLTEMIGQPWPEDDLVIIESAAPSLEGYGGWYAVKESEIEIGDSLDQPTMLHELSHAWFNPTRFADRWMIEGFAEEFSNRAVEQLGGTPYEPYEPFDPPPGLDGLADWRSRFFFEDTWDIEYYGYDTSYYVMRQLTDEIGVDGMARAIDGMLAGRLTYSIEDEPTVYPTNDWRRFLDMLEHEGGSTEAADLFSTYVVPADEQDRLVLRKKAQETYDAFERRTGDLGVPRGIRDAMSRWRFTTALDQMDRADQVIAELDRIGARAAQLGLTTPPYVADLYRSADGSFATASSAINDVDLALEAIEDRGPEADNVGQDRQNFQLGRLDRIEAVDLDRGGLNQEDNSRSPRPYFIAIGVLLVLLVGVIIAAGTALRAPAGHPE